MFPAATGIHPSAIISEGAHIGEGAAIGPYVVIGPQVRIGKNVRIASHVVIEGLTVLGDDNTIYQFASVGAAPQDLKYRGEASTLTLGDKNIVREYVTLQPGTTGGGMKTVIGSGNLFMANSHVGHDGMIGNGNVIANSCALAGHVTIGSFCVLGGLAAVHQFVCVGDYCLLGGGAMATRDVPPYCIAQGDRARLAGINAVGLERRGFSKEDVQRIRQLYRAVFLGEGRFNEKVEAAKSEFAGFKPAEIFFDFIDKAPRGVCPAGRGDEGEE